GPDDVDVAEEHAVQRHLRDVTADEADDQPPTPDGQAAHGVQGAVAAHGVEDEVHTTAGREGEGLALPCAVAAQHVVGPRIPGRPLLLVAGNHTDGDTAQGPCDLDGSGAGTAAGAVNQDGLARSHPPANLQGHDRRLVVEDEGR